MKLYQTPGGTWAGSEKDWSAAMKAEGLEPRKYSGRKIVEVPTAKADLMEFLTFHNVNVVSPAPTGALPPPPSPPLVRPEQTPAPAPTMTDLDDVFDALPLARQLHFAALACETARTRLK